MADPVPSAAPLPRPPAPAAAEGPPGRLAALALGSIGIVYGDIGTSPLYTLKECFSPDHGVRLGSASVLGVTSLIVWSLILVVTLKYVVFVMRADNRGEGGVLALLALAQRVTGNGPLAPLVLGLGMIGAGMFFGDGMITPAISVLSAIEGLSVLSPGLSPLVVPVSLGVLVGLFVMQSRGSESIGRLFGPVMLVWFLAIGAAGVVAIAGRPGIVAAIDPRHAITFLGAHGLVSVAVLGSVVLAVTGAEALYADMGHFGKLPIRLVWLGVALPALLLNYLGQAALLLEQPSALDNPFYRLFPDWALLPMIVLATCATVIASQAVISGVFSLTRQAIQLGHSPRLAIRHTSDEEEGQIYVPRANWGLLLGVVALVIGYGNSSNLAAAYGIAVTGTMAATTVLALVVARGLWGWPLWVCLGLGGVFLAIDLAFFGANLLKVAHGGWFPMVVGAGMVLLMATWRRGRAVLVRRLAEDGLPLEQFLRQQKDSEHIVRVDGTAIYLTGNTDTVPIALLHNMRHNKVLHRRVVFLTVLTDDIPRVPARDRVVVEGLADGFYRITVRYGFVQEPDIPKVLRLCKAFGLDFDMMQTTFFLGRESLIRAPQSDMPEWRERLFEVMSRNAVSPTEFFRLPPGRVVELGVQVQM